MTRGDVRSSVKEPQRSSIEGRINNGIATLDEALASGAKKTKGSNLAIAALPIEVDD